MRLQQKQQQRYRALLTPALQYSLKLLTLSSLDLYRELQDIVKENPLLEVEFSSAENNAEADSWQPTTPYPETFPEQQTVLSLTSHLQDQLLTAPGDTELHRVALAIIFALNDDGWLRTSLTEITSQPVPDQALLHRALTLVQSFDPAGIGARSLSECLLLQISRLASNPINTLAEKIASKHLEDVAKGVVMNFATPPQIAQALQVIRNLHPKPGEQFQTQPQATTPPDTVLVHRDGTWHVIENPALHLQVSLDASYYDMRAKTRINEASRKYLTEQIRTAKELKSFISYRTTMLLQVSNTIIAMQPNFCEHGERYLRPMTLSDIAAIIGVNISTVSRCIANKTLQTAHGQYLFRSLFSGQIAAGSNTISSQAIRARLKQFIANEDGRNPLSDQQLVAFLKKDDIHISRRTVAKYRKQMSIASAQQRKIY